jgi:uracil-DNA glycosylase family 4
LLALRQRWRADEPDWHNAPVPSFVPPLGERDVPLLIVGLAPGLRGANRTGRPFTGDGAGEMLFPTLLAAGFASGSYGRARGDGLTLNGCRITNAVRCVPPGNRPTPEEVRTCNRFLVAELRALPSLRVIVALGSIAHRAVLAAFELRPAAAPFAHGARHRLPGGLTLIDSYHCSRQNTNTGRLTAAMFRAIFEDLKPLLGTASWQGAAASHRSPAA